MVFLFFTAEGGGGWGGGGGCLHRPRWENAPPPPPLRDDYPLLPYSLAKQSLSNRLNFWPYIQHQQRPGQRQRWVGNRCVAVHVPTLRARYLRFYGMNCNPSSRCGSGALSKHQTPRQSRCCTHQVVRCESPARLCLHAV